MEEQKIPIPRSLMRVALSMMRRSVKKRAGFSIDEVAPIDKIHTSFIPVLFGEQHACIHCSCVTVDQWLLNQIHTCCVTVLFGEQHACIHRAADQRLLKPDSHLLCPCFVWQAACLHQLPAGLGSCPATWRHASPQLLSWRALLFLFSAKLCDRVLCSTCVLAYGQVVVWKPKVLLQAFCADINAWQ